MSMSTKSDNIEACKLACVRERMHFFTRGKCAEAQSAANTCNHPNATGDWLVSGRVEKQNPDNSNSCH